MRDKLEWGSPCIQLAPGNQVIGSEDCLFLNVWRPAKTSSAPLPVLVFLHGGSNVSGSSSDSWLGVKVYDGERLAAAGSAVVVTINYRLAAMGFMAHPAFAGEAPPGAHSAGNYGLLDQIAALEWVQHNIAAFGGDPTRVLLFGQSAGAFDTCDLLVSPLAAGLFSRAIMMSGGCSADVPEGAEWGAKKVASRVGCDPVTGACCDTADDVPACMRAAPASEVTTALGYWQIGSGSVFGAVVDGWVVPDDPLLLLRAGNYNRVPLMVGTTSDEMSHFIWAYIDQEVKTPAQYKGKLHELYGYAWGEEVFAQYPVSGYGSPMRALEAALGDELFICQSRRAALAAAQQQAEPVYRYVFAHAFADHDLAPDGADHGYDLFFAFDNLAGPKSKIHPTQAERELATAMSRALVRFAATGDPNGSGPTTWPEYTKATHQHMVLDTPSSVSTADGAAACAFWDALYGY